jgi:O-antigen ligase
MCSVYFMETHQSTRNFLTCFFAFFIFAFCPIWFHTDLTRNPYYTQIALLNILVPAVWLIWLIHAWNSSELVWVSTCFDVPLAALIGVSLVSWFVSFHAHPHFMKSIYSEGSKAAVFLLVNTYMVYAGALRVREVTVVRRLLWVIYAVCFIASLYGVLQYFGIELIWPNVLNPYGSRPVSTFGNPNFMSSYLVVVLPVMVADYLFKTSGCPRSILFMNILMSLAALLATLTRSSWAGLFVGLLVLLWGIGVLKEDRIPQNVLVGLICAMGALVLLWPASEPGFHPIVINRLMEVKRVSTEAYGSAFQRFLIWLSAWGMVQDHPFIGKGWGCFELFYPFYQGPLLMLKNLAARTHANNSHNEILEYWSQTGTVGLGIVIWMWVVFFRLAASESRRLTGSWKFIQWGMMGGVAGMLVDNLLNVSVHFAVPAFIFWWWIGSAMALDPAAIRVRRVDLHPLWRKGVIGLCSIGLICLMGRAVCLWAGEVYFFKGFKLSKGGVDLMSASRALETAYRWHPLEVNNNYELGNVYARMGDKDKALMMYQRALDANAGYDEIYFNRATLLMQMGRPEEAIASYRLCLAINPLSLQTYNALAALYFKDFKRYSNDVEALYLQGVQAYPADKEMWNNLGYIYTQREQWTQAAAAYENAIKVDPQFELARRNLAVVREKISAGSKR